MKIKNSGKKEIIKEITAREILDSRGNPTIEVSLETPSGIFFASVPSGASKGIHEATELRDGGERYNGKGVLSAVKNANEIIFPKIKGQDPGDQQKIDEILIALDGTKNKSKLGANAILAVSMAVCRAGAFSKKLPLYEYIHELAGKESNPALPRPCFNVINGGAHAGNFLDIQEFMAIPEEKSFSENLRAGVEIYQNLKEILKRSLGEHTINIGDEGGFSPPISKTLEILELLIRAKKNYPQTKIGLDCAASQFFSDEKYKLDGQVFGKIGLLKIYQDLTENYPIIFLEDPFSEDDWESFSKITEKIGDKVVIFGDDLLSTNIERINEAKNKKACNGAIIKPNQIGTIKETLEAVKLAKSSGWKIMVAHRSGDTTDDFIADLAVGIGADFIKSGAPARGERVVKYNRLLKIEEEIALGE